MHRPMFISISVFVLALFVVSCGGAPAPTNPPPAATNTRGASETLALPSPTLLATVTTAPSATAFAPTATSQLSPTSAPSATETTAPPPTGTPPPPQEAVTPISAQKYSAPTLILPLSKDVHYQKVSETITFKWNPPSGVTTLGANECYQLDIASYFVNGPKFYSDYYVVCDGTQFILSPKGGEGIPIWTTYVPIPAETMEMHWKVTVVLAGTILDKPTHRQTTPLSPASTEAVFMLQTREP